MTRNTITRRSLLGRTLGTAAVACLANHSRSPTLHAQESSSKNPDESVSRLAYDAPKSQTWRIGLVLDTPVTCTNVFATFPVPMDWPEQTVTLQSKEIDRRVTAWKVRDVAKGAKQVMLQIPKVAANTTAEVTFTMSIERSRILPPTKTDDLRIPKKIGRELRVFTSNSPYIDASNARIKMVSKELAAKDAANDWERVEQIYDYVRDNVRSVDGDLKNASVALREGKGDCEEMTSLIVALCRNAKVPARMVWIPDHCYPEFYLEDADGNGHWFPCQARGTRQFGRMDEYRPILQKGDRFKVPESRTPVRYVAEHFKCDRKGSAKPRPVFVRELVDG
ncbi:transglutaminase-like domain-containing protein [Planctomycetes bacterium K23_9]|uniref:Transglutaminase-like superfamily protein n=1 Tax=Stieleria marina TaxID=1930275 RepID=A0A517NTN5_9BACT|nr:Transglutaminase-like superfamily protein [Planctomycetes bacterium K23_9]